MNPQDLSNQQLEGVTESVTTTDTGGKKGVQKRMYKLDRK